MRHEFGTTTVVYTEVDGLLVAHAKGTAGEVWTASRSYSALLEAALQTTVGDSERVACGCSTRSEAEAMAEFRAMEKAERANRNWDAGLCHCGHGLYGSDHCPVCGCEEYEGTCDHNYHDSPHGRAHCDCPYHS